MEISVLGAGYVGLVQAAGLSSTGNSIFLGDISKEKIDLLNKGICPIFEPGLTELLKKGADKGLLQYFLADSPEYLQKLKDSEIIFIAVGTPQGENGEADLSHLYSAAESLLKLGSALNKKILVVKSTVPIGTSDKLDEFFQSKGFHPRLVSNPEFLKQGAAVQDFLRPERVIIGTSDEEAKKTLSSLYHPFMLKRERIVCMSRRSAELVKYACNSFLATKISFINEMSKLSEAVGADIREVREGMITDSRIGDQFLFPGIGYGGSCLPKDTAALIAQGKNAGVKMEIVEAADRVNQKQKEWIIGKLEKHFGGKLSGKVIAVWGLSFKPNTDDLRDAPSLFLLNDLFKKGAKVRAHDPAAMERIKSVFEKQITTGDLSLFPKPFEATKNADALAVLTEWQEYRTLDFKKLANTLRTPVIFDGRDIYDPEALRKEGFTYYGVGISSLPRS